MVSEGGLVFILEATPLVLILVLMEDGLGARQSRGRQDNENRVLILVLMEDGLGEELKKYENNL